jgi:hypothetical protein
MPLPKNGCVRPIGAPFQGEAVRSTERLKELHAKGDFEYMLVEGKQRNETGRCRRHDRRAFLRLVQFTDMHRLIIVRQKAQR